MARKYQANYEVDQLPYCCGVDEIGCLDIVEETEEYINSTFGQHLREKFFDTPRQAWEAKLSDIRENGHCPIVINFVKYKNTKRFENHELRTLINEQPDALIVHRWVNPNSGNIVEMYVLTNGSKV